MRTARSVAPAVPALARRSQVVVVGGCAGALRRLIGACRSCSPVSLRRKSESSWRSAIASPPGSGSRRLRRIRRSSRSGSRRKATRTAWSTRACPATPPRAGCGGWTGRSRSSPRSCIVELGANDALRGQDLAACARTSTRSSSGSRPAGARVLLAGMRLPPNYGAGYGAEFQRLFEDVAKQRKVAFMPFFLDGVGGDARLNQPRRHPSDGRGLPDHRRTSSGRT